MSDLKSLVVYFRSNLQPFLCFTDDNTFESKACLIDQVGSVWKTSKISPFLFAHIFVEEDGSGGDSLHGGCVN